MVHVCDGECMAWSVPGELVSERKQVMGMEG